MNTSLVNFVNYNMTGSWKITKLRQFNKVRKMNVCEREIQNINKMNINSAMRIRWLTDHLQAIWGELQLYKKEWIHFHEEGHYKNEGISNIVTWAQSLCISIFGKHLVLNSKLVFCGWRTSTFCIWYTTYYNIRHIMLLWFVKIYERNLKKLQFTTQCFDIPV